MAVLNWLHLSPGHQGKSGPGGMKVRELTLPLASCSTWESGLCTLLQFPVSWSEGMCVGKLALLLTLCAAVWTREIYPPPLLQVGNGGLRS